MELPLIPERLFADREEPNGDRVNQYFKLNTIRVILKALQPMELEKIRPVFGRLLDVYAKPVFSGKLCHFLLSRQLNVGRRHEIWVVFAGKPIKFSLREFEVVTGLNCNPLPDLDNDLLKCPPGVTPYWFTLFGGEECVTGEMLLSKLRKHKSLSSEVKVKYACLLLVDGLLCRRSFHMKIPKEHVELIRDLDVFLNYPWGRYCFDMTMQSIKSRNVNQLAQATVAIQGFIHALKLVFFEAVPDARLAVGDGSDPESGDEDVQSVMSLKLDKLWDLDDQEEVEVIPIIPGGGEESNIDDWGWNDEVNDDRVVAMVNLIETGVQFCRDMFVGGRRRVAAPVVPPPRVVNTGKRRVNVKLVVGESSRGKKARLEKGKLKNLVDPNENLLAAVAAQVQAGLKDMEMRIQNTIRADIPVIVAEIITGRELVANVVKDVLGTANNGLGSIYGTSRCVAKAKGPVGENVGVNVRNHGSGVVVPDGDVRDRSTRIQPTDSLEESSQVAGEGRTGESSDESGEVLNEKFQKLVSIIYPSMNFSFGNGLVLQDKDLLGLPTSIPPDSSKVMDSCVMVIRESLFSNVDPAADKRADMLTSTFAVSLATMHARFKKSTRKDSFDFDLDFVHSIMERFALTGKQWLTDIDFVYFPFNIDKNRWVGVVVDLLSSSLTVLDSTAGVRRGSRIKPEFDFICEMFPLLVRKIAANDAMKAFSPNPLKFARNTHVVQASDRAHTGILTLLFMEAHATGGMEKVFSVKESEIRGRGEQLAVEMYEHCFGDMDVA